MSLTALAVRTQAALPNPKSFPQVPRTLSLSSRLTHSFQEPSSSERWRSPTLLPGTEEKMLEGVSRLGKEAEITEHDYHDRKIF